MQGRNTKDSGFSIVGTIEQKTHRVDDLKQSVDDWDSLTPQEKLEATRQVDPETEQTVYNITTDELHQYFVDNLDPGNVGAEANVTSSWLGLGTNAAGGTATTDTDLNTRTFEKQVTDHADNGKDLLASTFLDSTEGNGNTFDELGLFSGDPANLANAEVFLINHATFSPVTKDNTKTVTFDVTLTFADA